MNQISLWGRFVLKPIDGFLDRLTSYKLVNYTLLVYLTWAVIGSLTNKVPYHWYSIIISAVELVGVCWLSNKLVSEFLNIPANNESYFITALILCLILSPPGSLNDALILAAAGVVAVVSKYIVTIRRWHIFNPAALAAFISGLLFRQYASWWIGTAFLIPLVVAGGFLILRKMQRLQLALMFLLVSLVIINWSSLVNQPFPTSWNHIWLALTATQIVFFASVMLPEPLTSPRQTSNIFLYGLLVAFLYSYTKLKISPEIALLLGNVFAFLIEPQSRQVLTFIKKRSEASDILSFFFKPQDKINYKPGQYMEWTMPSSDSDFRGNRRYLTLASSPTEESMMFSVRMPNPSSSFKRHLNRLNTGETILAAQVSGEFTLPKSTHQKLAFLAGGIGVTPYRSMVKYMLDANEKRPIKMLYSANSPDEFVFKELLIEAEKVGLKTVFTTGRLNENVLTKTYPDFAERVFYVSGPYGFVRNAKDGLLKIGVAPKKIVSDYFPGYG
jgi:ferredoxin-NADP reductase